MLGHIVILECSLCCEMLWTFVALIRWLFLGISLRIRVRLFVCLQCFGVRKCAIALVALEVIWILVDQHVLGKTLTYVKLAATTTNEATLNVVGHAQMTSHVSEVGH